MNRKLRDFLFMTAGTILVAVGLYYFKMPNHFSTGGVSGIAIILGALIPGLSTGTINFIINMLLLLLGFLVFGRGFGAKTAYASMLMSSIVWGLERIQPMDAFTDEPLLELFFAVGLPAVGSAILFNIGASTGGTDIIAMIVKKYSSVDIGKALFISDCVIVITACIVFGMQTGLFAIMGLVLKTLVVDMVIESINLSKFFTVITSNPEPIVKYINETLKRGATIEVAEGSYSHQKRYIILTATRRHQAMALRAYARQMDPHAFIMITNSSEIIGKGFSEH